MQSDYTPSPKDISRFWNKVDRSGGPDACWTWKASYKKQNYGGIGWKGKILLSHRVAYEITFGEIPDGLDICHSCDNPPCCNPSHLFLGTPLNNAQDRTKKKRNGSAPGESHGMHKLTIAQVSEIRQRHKPNERGEEGSRALAQEFGVCKGTIQGIANRTTWK